MKSREIISSISKDLSISRIANETDDAFISRVSYSALGLWARFLASQKDDRKTEAGNIYKSTHHRKMVGVLNTFQEQFDCLKTYYSGDDPIARIRDALFASMDLIEIGFNSRISLGDQKYIRITDDWCVRIGSAQITKGMVLSGASVLVPATEKCSEGKSLLEIFQIPSESAESILNKTIDSAKWELAGSISDLEFFDQNRKGVLSSCWLQSFALDNTPCMVRKKHSFGPYEYYLAKTDGDNVLLSRFSEFSQRESIRETQRLLYGFKATSRNQFSIRIDQFEKYSLWRFWSKLPPQEERLLRYIGWPVEDIESQTNSFILNNHLNSLLRSITDNLGLIREEHAHE